jgi:hypothetical protein
MWSRCQLDGGREVVEKRVMLNSKSDEEAPVALTRHKAQGRWRAGSRCAVFSFLASTQLYVMYIRTIRRPEHSNLEGSRINPKSAAHNDRASGRSVVAPKDISASGVTRATAMFRLRCSLKIAANSHRRRETRIPLLTVHLSRAIQCYSRHVDGLRKDAIPLFCAPNLDQARSP